jgi:hypothetical protein
LALSIIGRYSMRALTSVGKFDKKYQLDRNVKQFPFCRDALKRLYAPQILQAWINGFFQ